MKMVQKEKQNYKEKKRYGKFLIYETLVQAKKSWHFFEKSRISKITDLIIEILRTGQKNMQLYIHLMCLTLF